MSVSDGHGITYLKSSQPSRHGIAVSDLEEVSS